MNGLLEDLLHLGRGTRLGDNVSALGYCDDLVLLSPNFAYIREMLTICDRYAAIWKVEFNGQKSVSYEFGRKKYGNVDFFIGGER